MRIILFTGKGGVGKTTAACATALRLADRGTKSLLVSTDAAHSVADALDQPSEQPLGAEPTEVAPSLWAVQLDSQRRFEAAWREVRTYLLRLLDQAGIDPITAEELTVLPGIDEVLSLLAVRELASTGDWDTLVLDCAATAETLRLLALPEALGWYLQKVLPAQRVLARGVRPLATLLGRGDTIPPDAVFAALVQLSGELAAVRDLLSDPDTTSVRLVLTPEAVVTAEARRTFTALSLYGYRVDGVIANRVFPAPDSFSDGGGTWQQGWVDAQRRELAGLRDSFAGLPVRELPYADAEPLGVDRLRLVAAQLYGALPGADPATIESFEPALTVEPVDDEYVLRLRLPLADRAQVEATRAGDDLVVTVAGYRRVLALPSVLRRCDVVGGRFEDEQLTVRFRPDPNLWPASRLREAGQ